jgi:hypothetical protein
MALGGKVSVPFLTHSINKGYVIGTDKSSLIYSAAYLHHWQALV